MIVKKDEIISLFHLKEFGSKNWMAGDCPLCNKVEHLGVIFGEKISSFRCLKCGVQGTLFSLLKKIQRLDLVDKFKIINKDRFLENKIEISNEQIDLDLSLPKKSMPLGFKRVTSHPYLKSRDFTPEQIQLFKAGVTSLIPKLKSKYIIFAIEEGGECKGYISRSIWSKKTIDIYNKGVKRHNNIMKIQGGPLMKKHSRYQNSPDTDFGKMVLGIEEIIVGVTKTMILVEGLTDKANVDRKLGLYQIDEMKCGATFGKKISPFQIKKLQDKGIEDIVLIYDSEAVSESKQYSIELNNYFNVEVGFIKGDKDPGDLNQEEMHSVLNKLENPIAFNVNKVKKVELS